MIILHIKEKILLFDGGGLIDDIEQYNYLIYKNEAYSNKFYYCYIDSMDYINDNCTHIHITTDVFQTYQFDFIYKQCFVEREHVNDDSVGLHTQPESIEHGDYVLNRQSRYYPLSSSFVYIIQSPVWANYTGAYRSTDLGGITFKGLVYVTDQITKVNDIIEGLNGENVEPTNVYVVPKSITTWTPPSNPQSWQDYEWHGQVAPAYLQHSFNKPTSINDYTPTNNKLLTFPYNYLIVSNNSGSSTKLKYEHFTSSDCEFDIYGTPTCRWFNSSCTTLL